MDHRAACTDPAAFFRSILLPFRDKSALPSRRGPPLVGSVFFDRRDQTRIHIGEVLVDRSLKQFFGKEFNLSSDCIHGTHGGTSRGGFLCRLSAGESGKFWGAANFWERQIFRSSKFWGAINFEEWQILGSIKFGGAANLRERPIFGSDKFWGAINFGEWQILGSIKFGGATNFGKHSILGSIQFWGAANLREHPILRSGQFLGASDLGNGKCGEPKILGYGQIWRATNFGGGGQIFGSI